MDNDGQMEIVFGNSSGKLYIVNHDGSQQLAYSILGFIEGSPALIDIDGDQDLEIIFTPQRLQEGSFTVFIIMVLQCLGFLKSLVQWVDQRYDIDNDGVHDIICTTYDKEVYAVNVNGGTVKPGFPVMLEGRLDISPTIVDIDNDGDYEIAVGSNDGELMSCITTELFLHSITLATIFVVVFLFVI